MGRWIRSCLVGIALLAALALGAASASAEEPSLEYEAYVTAEYQGTYEEQYVDAQGDNYFFVMSFDMTSKYDLQWLSDGTLRTSNYREPVVKATGLMMIEVAKSGGGFFEPETCDYSALSPLPGDNFPINRAGPAGQLDIDAFIPHGTNYLAETSAPTAYNCSDDASLGTPGAPAGELTYDEGLAPIVEVNVRNDPNYLQDVSSKGSPVFGTGSYSIEGSVRVTSEPGLSGPSAPPPAKPVEKIEPSTPIEPPTAPPHTPTETKPIIEEIGEPIWGTGGGGQHGKPPKLKTGLRAKCPTATTGCKVTGILVASMPSAPGTLKASGTNAKQRDVTIGSTSFKLATGASSPVTIALSRSGFALLREDHHLPVSITVSVAAPGRASVKHSRALTLRLPGKH
jgi:hypothetical protein